MNNRTTTIVLLVLITLLAMWKSGKLQKWLNTVFG